MVPDDFLQTARRDIIATRIKFAEGTLPEYKDCYACILDNVLSAEECDLLVRCAEVTTDGVWERAQVNIGGGHQRMIEELRKCGRIIYDSQELATRIWKRIEAVPEVTEILSLQNCPLIVGPGPVKRNEIWAFTRPNERLRFLKYVGGEYFKEHCDGTYETPDKAERSYFTMHLYLSTSLQNNAQDSSERGVPTIGGATIFHPRFMDYTSGSSDMKVDPVPGRILIFQHRGLLHSGEDIAQGVKYTMRTDLMYKLAGYGTSPSEQPKSGASLSQFAWLRKSRESAKAG